MLVSSKSRRETSIHTNLSAVYIENGWGASLFCVGRCEKHFRAPTKMFWSSGSETGGAWHAKTNRAVPIYRLLKSISRYREWTSCQFDDAGRYSRAYAVDRNAYRG
jgi:hypothetical protein